MMQPCDSRDTGFRKTPQHSRPLIRTGSLVKGRPPEHFDDPHTACSTSCQHCLVFWSLSLSRLRDEPPSRVASSQNPEADGSRGQSFHCCSPLFLFNEETLLLLAKRLFAAPLTAAPLDSRRPALLITPACYPHRLLIGHVPH